MLDLKAKNNTTQKYQILITFDEKYIYGTLCTDGEILYSYEIYNRNVVEFQKEGRSFIKFEVWRRKKRKVRWKQSKMNSYIHKKSN